VQSDQLFKEFLKEFLPEFTTLFFPNVAKQLDFTTLKFLDKELFTDFLKGDVREADLVAEVTTLTGTPQMLLLHVEVQGQRRKEFAERMWEYYITLWTRHRQLILPMVVYLSPGTNGGLVKETFRIEGLGETPVVFTYSAIGLPDMSAEEWADKGGEVSAALATVMKSPKGERVQRAFDSLKAVVESTQNEMRKLLLADIIERLGRDKWTEQEQATFEELMASDEAREIKPMISVYEERAIVRLTIRQLGSKFGTEAAELLRRQIESLPATDLESFGEALLNFATPSEAEAWLSKVGKANNN
jgi:hypothetical protein